MAQFQPIILEYLEHYQPETFRELCASKQLRAYLQALVERLYIETDSAAETLRPLNLDMSEDQLQHYAEQMAIEAVLPMPSDTVPAKATTQEETIT